MNITARVIKFGDIIQVSEKFRKRELVVEYATNPQYPQKISFEITQNNCDSCPPLVPGQEVDIHFDLRGREWVDRQGETKYFNSLNAWRILPVGEQPAAPPQQQGVAQPYATPPPMTPFPPAGEDVDPLPF